MVSQIGKILIFCLFYIVYIAGRLYPLNERATRTIRNLYIENERVLYIGLPWSMSLCCAFILAFISMPHISFYLFIFGNVIKIEHQDFYLNSTQLSLLELCLVAH